MALSDLALCSVANVQKALSLPVVDTEDFDDVIEDASSMIVEWLGRPLHRDPAVHERHVGDGSSAMLLLQRPVHSIVSVGFAGQALDATAYELANGEVGSVFFPGGLTDTARRWSGIAGDPLLGSARMLYDVVYDGGYVTPGQSGNPESPYFEQPVTLPRTIRRAAIELACFVRSNPAGDDDISSESGLSYSVSYRGGAVEAGSGGLPPGVRAKLQRYRDIPMG